MYHIKEDKRSKQSAETIYQSLRHVLFTKKLEDVTISDIQKECGISRSTFYRCFDTITDVLEMKLFYFVEKYFREQQSAKDRVLFFYTYWDKHSDFIHILSKQNESLLKNVLKRHFKNKFVTTNEIYQEYLLDIKISLFTSLLCKWVERNKKESPQEMAILTKIILPKSISLLIDF